MNLPEGDEALGGWIAEALLEVVAIPSFSGEEHALVDQLEARCAGWDLPVRRLPVAGAADDLLIGWTDRPDILLTAHLDTIRPGWDPPAGEVRDGRVVGLGAQDDAAGIVAALLALLLARDSGVQVTRSPVAVGLCVDEEMGGTGSIEMAERLRPAAVVGLEGTELRPAIAQAGFVEVWVHVAGLPAHGALREEGHNAIEEAHRLIGRILDHPGARHEHPLLGRNIPMLWEIRGGGDLNVVPDRCSFHLDWRVTPGGPSATALLDWLVMVAAEHRAEVEVVEIVEPFETPADAPVVTALGRAIATVTGREPKPAGMPAWTDAHNFVERAGSQAVVFGPGSLRGAHQPGESVGITDVLTCARILARLIADLTDDARRAS